MKNRTFRLTAATLVLLGGLLCVTPTFAADALAICEPGVPFAYPNGGIDIPFNPDLGDLGPLGNAAAVAAVTDAFDAWAAVAESTVTYVNAGPLAFDVTLANYGPIANPVAPNGISEIVFDEDGSIFTDLFGPGSGILGFAGPDFGDTVTCELLEGSAFLNGPEFTDALVAEDIMVHEFGHYTNLGHVELNGQLVAFAEGGDDSGPSPDNATFGAPPGFLGTEVIETMYPFYFGSPDVGTRTLHADDVASLANIYPAPGYPSSAGSISGTIFAADGVTRLSGVNVIARNLADPFVDSVSTFSGAYTDGTGQGDPNVGTYALNNLTPGATYAVFIDQVTADPARFSNPILLVPGPEEFWNAAESNDDPPLDFTGITVAANSPDTGIDIIVNEPQPGEALQVGEDGAVELSLGFEFEICEQSFSSVFVNANGHLTFGAPDPDFTPSAAEFLAGPPRVAGLWADLSPFNFFTGVQQGTVTFDRSNNRFTASWIDVPEFVSTGSNSFDITLKRASNRVEVDYGGLTATTGVGGVSCGGFFTTGSEEQVDLSHNGTKNLTQTPAAYEVFDAANPVDLAGDRVKFNGSKKFDDKFEDNDTPSEAAFIDLPFNSDNKHDYTDILPVGADIDWFAFDVSAGDILVAEITSGQLDSLIALFDSAGNLVTFDDDGGSGLLSRLAAVVPADDTWLLAVTTFPDSGLTGAGGSGGRYVLDIAAGDELPLSLGDDDSVEVDLPFSFPYQGGSFDSVFVNSNGSLTFGTGDTDFSESVGELLSGPPRIAPLWDDLSPNAGGSVSVSFGSGSVTVEFVDVPEFLATTTNTFSVTLADDGSVDVVYGAVAATDGLVGVTEGGGAADPGETDLSAGGPFSANGTTYEEFTGDNDLAGGSLSFVP